MSDAAGPHALTLPHAALHALRAAVLAGPDGEQRLRDAGYASGQAAFDDFAEHVRAESAAGPDALPLTRFTAALTEYLQACGWGTARIEVAAEADVLRVSSADWIEGDPTASARYPACHFSTGLLAGFFARAAQAPLAVLEVACRSAGDDRCEFVLGSQAVLDALWEELRGREESGRRREAGA